MVLCGGAPLTGLNDAFYSFIHTFESSGNTITLISFLLIGALIYLSLIHIFSDWRTDLGGKRNFHNGVGGTYDCIAIMSYYVVCKAVTSFREDVYKRQA